MNLFYGEFVLMVGHLPGGGPVWAWAILPLIPVLTQLLLNF